MWAAISKSALLRVRETNFSIETFHGTWGIAYSVYECPVHPYRTFSAIILIPPHHEVGWNIYIHQT